MLQKQLGFAKYCLKATCEIPLNRIRIDRDQKQISAQGMIVITSKPNGTLKSHKHEAVRVQIIEKMNQWTAKKLIRKTVSSHQKDNVKRDDDMTSSSYERDTAGGGRGTFSNAYGDAPMSILQQRHTSNTHHSNDNFHYKTTTTLTTQKKKNKASAAKKENKKDNHSEISSDIIHKNARCLKNEDRLDELPKELEESKWDAVLLCDTWRQGKKHLGLEM